MNYFDKLWETAYPTTIKELQGIFAVNILSGWVRLIEAVYKVRQKRIEDQKGCNIQSNKAVGHFILWPQTDYMLFDYNQPRYNTRLWLRLQDQVKQIDDSHFIGKIYFKLWHKYLFIGYFSLTQKEDL